jgi:Gluconate 2-dehydrogenase subunit 3
MTEEQSTSSDQTAALSALANGIIPADGTDSGAAAVDAGPRLAERVRTGVNAALYIMGLELANSLARNKHARDVPQLSPAEIHDLLAAIRDELPGFFKQLRMDVSALYLSDPAVWRRIGFPGPSAEAGGYPDFDQPQNGTGGGSGARLTVVPNGNSATSRTADPAQ